MRAIMSSPTRRATSVCCARSRASSAIARARARRSGTSGLATGDRAATTDIGAMVARMERPRNPGRCRASRSAPSPLQVAGGGAAQGAPTASICGACAFAHAGASPRGSRSVLPMAARTTGAKASVEDRRREGRDGRSRCICRAGSRGRARGATSRRRRLAVVGRAARRARHSSSSTPSRCCCWARSPTPIRWWTGSACSTSRSTTSSPSSANPNVHLALANSLIACAGGTALAVAIGLTFSWIVVRTNTPWQALHRRPRACCRCSCRRWSRASPGRSSARRSPACSTP